MRKSILSVLDVICWKWKPALAYRSQFTHEAVNTLQRMVARFYPRPHRFSCITDDATGIDDSVRIIPLWNDFSNLLSPHGPGNPSCYRRLKMFSAEAAEIIGARFLSLDLDCVITGDLSPLVDRDDDLVLWGDTNPKTFYNGSMILHTPGTRTKIWDEFDPVKSPVIARKRGHFGSDQAWLSACLGPDEKKWTRADGVYSYRNEIKTNGGALPADARIVMFHGHVDPWSHEAVRLPWVKEHWR